MIESSEGPLWWKEIDVPANGLDLSIPVDKAWKRHDLYLSTLVVRPGINPNPPRRNARSVCCICRWATKIVA
jgi:uncharacterized protein YfaS (alpha-2-macroglobulin family)